MDTELGELFARVARKQRRATLAALEPCGVSPHQARALRVAVQHSPLRPSQLAEQLSISLRSATQVVDALVAAGLLERTPDPDDRRAVLLSPTPQGVASATQIAAIRARESARFMAALDDYDRGELRRILTKLAAF